MINRGRYGSLDKFLAVEIAVVHGSIFGLKSQECIETRRVEWTAAKGIALFRST